MEPKKKETKDWEALGVSPAMKEAAKEQEENDGGGWSSFAISGAMKEDLKRIDEEKDSGFYPGFGGDNW